MARAAGGQFLLRIEDIDSTRCRPNWEKQIFDDLSWLGITWDAAPMRQSDRGTAYQDALRSLWRLHCLYTCSCSRKDILGALSAPQEGASVAYGPDGPIYPGTCRALCQREGTFPENQVLRLDMAAALDGLIDANLVFAETGIRSPGITQQMTFATSDILLEVGDIVVSRKDFIGSYHLSVVLDDAFQGVTHVVRGDDLFDATQIHVILQKLLQLPTPVYHHHALIRDENGRRLAKRDDARAISKYREDGATPADIRHMVGLN